MPLYDFQCRSGHRFERYATVAGRKHVRCKCGRMAQIRITTAPGNGARTWRGKESTSLQMCFNPKEIAKLKRDCPSAELHPNGAMKFNSDSHQRKVFREMRDAKERLEAKNAVAASRSLGL